MPENRVEERLEHPSVGLHRTVPHVFGASLEPIHEAHEKVSRLRHLHPHLLDFPSDNFNGDVVATSAVVIVLAHVFLASYSVFDIFGLIERGHFFIPRQHESPKCQREE
ncbi:MAG: hypothetical protein II894_02820 [Bacteroidales bacterium]|nr:hypothetical protein [Bacteroidales bacterium]